jgi:SAM-dependent methyltransferase
MDSRNVDDWYAFIKKIMGDIGFSGTDIMDLGCGTGEILMRLANDRYKVVGVDISPEMLLVAREKIDESRLEIPLVNQDMTELHLPVEVDLVLSLFDTVNYLTDIEELDTAFENINKHLAPGGFFIFDAATRKLIDEIFSDGVYVDDREEFTIIWSHFMDDGGDIDNIHTTYFIKEKNFYKRIDELHRKRIYTEKEVENTSLKNGFEIIKKYKDVEMAGERIFYVLKKVEGR